MGFGMPMMGMPAQSAYAGSLYGGVPGPNFMPGVPRNSVATNLNMFGGGGGGLMQPPSMAELQQRPMSTFSLATTANPFASTPSQSTDPTDEELLQVLRIYLSTQDLMTVTKKCVESRNYHYGIFDGRLLTHVCRTAREAVMARFPKADLSSRKEFLNQSIDRVLSGS
jgi:chitin synthase